MAPALPRRFLPEKIVATAHASISVSSSCMFYLVITIRRSSLPAEVPVSIVTPSCPRPQGLEASPWETCSPMNASHQSAPTAKAAPIILMLAAQVSRVLSAAACAALDAPLIY